MIVCTGQVGTGLMHAKLPRPSFIGTHMLRLGYITCIIVAQAIELGNSLANVIVPATFKGFLAESL